MINLKYFTLFALIATVASYAIDSRVVGGVEADPDRFPFICGLQILEFEIAFICGSSIITPEFVLTSAHCIIAPIEEYTVHCGTWNRTIIDEDRQIRHVDEQFLHPGFDPDNLYLTLHYDIALLQLNESLIFTFNVQPITIIPPGFDASGANATAIGWGADHPLEETFPQTLQVAYMQFISLWQCAEIDFIVELNVTVDQMFCTQAIVGGLCGGDSGSPMVQEVDGEYIQLGIATWASRPCGGPDAVAGFIDLSFFNDFVEEIVSENSRNL